MRLEPIVAWVETNLTRYSTGCRKISQPSLLLTFENFEELERHFAASLLMEMKPGRPNACYGRVKFLAKEIHFGRANRRWAETIRLMKPHFLFAVLGKKLIQADLKKFLSAGQWHQVGKTFSHLFTNDYWSKAKKKEETLYVLPSSESDSPISVFLLFVERRFKPR